MTNNQHTFAASCLTGIGEINRTEQILIGSFFAFIALAVTQPIADLYRACFFLGILPATIYLTIAEHRWKLLAGDRLLWVVLALLIYFYLSVFWSHPFNGNLAIQYLRWFIETLVFSTAVYLYASTKQFERFPHGACLLWLLLVAIAISLVIYFIHQDFPKRLRGIGLLEHEILGSGVLITLWALALMDPKIWVPRQRPLVIAALLSVFVFVYLTQSRGPLLSLVILCAVLALFVINNRRQVVAAAMALGAAGYICSHYFGWTFPLLNKMLSRGDSYRLDIWRSIIDTLPSYWLYGQGIATEFAQSNAGAITQHATGIEIIHPHNLWLATLFYGGLLGAILLLGLLATLLLRLRRLERVSAGIAFGVITAAMALCMTDTHRLLSSPREIWVIFWLPLMMVAGATARPIARLQGTLG